MYYPLDVNTISNLDCNNPMGGKKDLSQSIQRSFFSNILNYVNDTIRICNSNHSRSESCTSGCVPLNLSKFDFNYFYLSDKTFLFFLAQSVLLFNQSLNSDQEKQLQEFITSVNLLKISLRAKKKGIFLNFNNDIMSDIHKKLLAKYKGDLRLPDNPLSLSDHCSNKLIKLMTDEDKILKEVKKAVHEGKPLDKFGAYLKNFQRDIHVKEGLLFNDNKLIVPAALRSPFLSLLHETHPGQFGMKALAENIWWPHLYREIYHHGKNCTQCIMAGKNLKVLLGTNKTEKLPNLTEPNEEVDFDFAGPLDKSWGNAKYLLLCIDRFSKFPSAKVVNNTSTSSILNFMTDYCHLHGFPKSIRADHGSCFTSFDFRNFCEKNNINLILCTVGDHRSNGVVERLIYTVKAKLLAMSFNDPKPSLNTAIDKIIWNIRSTKQSSIGCSPFSKHFNRSPNTFWKSLVSHAISLDKGKSIISKDRAQDWGADDAFEDGYLEDRTIEERGYESDPANKVDRNLQRAPLSNPFSHGGNWFRKTVNRREGEPYFKPLGSKPLSDTKHTVTLDNGHKIRKSDLAFNKTQPAAPKTFTARPKPLINSNDLAGKRKRNSPCKRRDSNIGGPSMNSTPTGGNSSKKRRSFFTNSKVSKFDYNNLDSSLTLDLWDKVIDDYLGTETEIVYNTPTVNLHSDLDQPRSTIQSQTNTETTFNIPTGTSDDPIRVDSSPEKTVETPKTPISSKHRVRRNPGPPKFFGERRFIDQVTLGTETISAVDSDDEPLITFSGAKSPKQIPSFCTTSPSDYLTPIDEIPRHTILVAETTQDEFSTPSSQAIRTAWVSPPLVEGTSNTQDDIDSDISSGIDTDVRIEADNFHTRYNSTVSNSENF